MALTALDADDVIAVLSRRDAHHAAARAELALARANGEDLALPASAYAEILVEPFGSRAAAVR